MIATELPEAPRAATAPTAGTSALPFPAPVDSPPDWPRTIGVAIPIPEPFLAELGAYRERFGDPLAHAIVAHITLVPPSQVANPQEMAAVARHLEQVATRIAPFRVVLAGAGTFRPVSPVVFVPLGAGEEQVRAVEQQVRRGPLERMLNFPYHPHVTVAHDVAPEWLDEAEDTMADYRAEFEVSSLGLFEHGQGGVWRQVQEFPFTG
jgi:2'-5' RNA ligase